MMTILLQPEEIYACIAILSNWEKTVKTALDKTNKELKKENQIAEAAQKRLAELTSSLERINSSLEREKTELRREEELLKKMPPLPQKNLNPSPIPPQLIQKTNQLIRENKWWIQHKDGILTFYTHPTTKKPHPLPNSIVSLLPQHDELYFIELYENRYVPQKIKKIETNFKEKTLMVYVNLGGIKEVGLSVKIDGNPHLLPCPELSEENLKKYFSYQQRALPTPGSTPDSVEVTVYDLNPLIAQLKGLPSGKP